jgi:hypothetical protein
LDQETDEGGKDEGAIAGEDDGISVGRVFVVEGVGDD